MQLLVFWILIFIISLYVLIKASDYFTESAENIGICLGISPFIVGVTIVAIGTSLPELVSSIIAVVQNSSEIVIGNVLGSNIANIFLLLKAICLNLFLFNVKFEDRISLLKYWSMCCHGVEWGFVTCRVNVSASQVVAPSL